MPIPRTLLARVPAPALLRDSPRVPSAFGKISKSRFLPGTKRSSLSVLQASRTTSVRSTAVVARSSAPLSRLNSPPKTSPPIPPPSKLIPPHPPPPPPPSPPLPLPHLH